MATAATADFWKNAHNCQNAEREYYEHLSRVTSGGCPIKEAPAKKQDNQKSEKKSKQKNKAATTAQAESQNDSLTTEVQKVRQQIRDSIKDVDQQIKNAPNKKNSPSLEQALKALTLRVEALETIVKTLTDKSSCKEVAPQTKPANPKGEQQKLVKQPTKKQQKDNKKQPAKETKETKNEKKQPAKDDDFDLFDSSEGEDDEAAKKLKEERLAAYAAKKSKKPALIAKSNIIFDVKPWSDDTDMKKLEASVRTVTHDGLLWGAAKLVPLAYGIHKLQISCVIEDDKVSVDWIQETIESEGAEFVQSVDIAAFNKV